MRMAGWESVTYSVRPLDANAIRSPCEIRTASLHTTIDVSAVKRRVAAGSPRASASVKFLHQIQIWTMDSAIPMAEFDMGVCAPGNTGSPCSDTGTQPVRAIAWRKELTCRKNRMP